MAKGAHHSRSNVVCDALLLDEASRSDTYPYIEIEEDDVTVGHEASVSKVGEEQVFYLMSRGLSEDEVSAIGEHEHIPQIAACGLADYLLKQPHGGEAIRRMIVDDIQQALSAGRIKHAQELFMALRHFLESHPEARAGVVET